MPEPVVLAVLPRLLHLVRTGVFSSWVHGPFLAVVGLSVFFVAGPWAGFHGVLLGVAGLLVLLRPPIAALPRTWCWLAAVFLVLACASFLPAEWFDIPAWRHGLAALGVETGDRVVIQTRQAVETLALFALTLLTGLWLSGHRASPETLRRCALAFTLTVAAYALVSRLIQVSPLFGGGGQEIHKFGVFPNRNHSATYLAIGAVCGLGTVLQSGRDKRFLTLVLALAATALILWAVAAWSISRAGVLLTSVGLLGWMSLLGRRYLGRHGRWALALILLASGGFFLLSDTRVKQRLTHTVEKATSAVDSAAIPQPKAGKPALDPTGHLDFRIPVFLDTLEMIGTFPWTGVGAGQFYDVFPQYREHTITAQDADVHHPESDWLWIAAELGIPAALTLLVLVVLAALAAVRGVRSGRDRALRSACLVAALLVPLHGVIDVPGHRISLAWTAALLFGLSLSPSQKAACKRARLWSAYTMGPLLLLASAFLIRAQWLDAPPPATTAGQSAIQQARALCQKGIELQKSAWATGVPQQFTAAGDSLEKALQILDAAKSTVPLNREIRRHEAFIAFHFGDRYDRIDQAFAIDRALDPSWIAGPLRQAEAWASIDPRKSADLAAEALRRARAIDRIDPSHPWSSSHTLSRMRHFLIEE